MYGTLNRAAAAAASSFFRLCSAAATAAALIIASFIDLSRVTASCRYDQLLAFCNAVSFGMEHILLMFANAFCAVCRCLFMVW